MFFLIAKFNHCLIGALNEFLGLTTKIKERFSFTVVCGKEKSQVLHCRVTSLLYCCTPNWQSWRFFTKVWHTTSFWHSCSLVIMHVDLKTGKKTYRDRFLGWKHKFYVWFSEQLPYIGLWQKSRTEHLSESDYSLILFYCFCLFFG